MACQIQIINNNRKIDVSEYMDNETYTGNRTDNSQNPGNNIKNSTDTNSVDNNINTNNINANDTDTNTNIINTNGTDTSVTGGNDSYSESSIKGQTGTASRKEKALQVNSQNGNNALTEKEAVINEAPDPVMEYKKMEEAKFYKHMNIRNKRVLKKAFQGNASSQCEMGDYYAEKDGGHLDYTEAAKWYSASARKGYERASFELGKLYDQNPPEIEGAKDKAVQIYTTMAEQGLPTAQCILGMKYWFGDGVEIDFNKAITWLKKAAAQKHDTAIRNLADLYAAISDSENAYRWYKIGATSGDDYCRKKLRNYNN